MLDFLRRLFGRNRRGAPPRQDAQATGPQPPDDPGRSDCPLSDDQGGDAQATGPQPSDDPELRQILDRIDRKWTDVLQRERAAEELLTPRERLKKRLNLPTELPADSRAKGPVPVLSPARNDDTVPMTVVVNNVGIGINMPHVLFGFLYRQRQLTAADQLVINTFLERLGLQPESFEPG
jgi:hypothetical protein